MDLDEEELRTTRKKKKLEKDDLTTVYLNGFYDGEEKWKNKIKKTMKLLQKDIEKDRELLDYSSINEILYENQIKLLKKILEEDNYESENKRI